MANCTVNAARRVPLIGPASGVGLGMLGDVGGWGWWSIYGAFEEVGVGGLGMLGGYISPSVASDFFLGFFEVSLRRNASEAFSVRMDNLRIMDAVGKVKAS